MELAGLSSLSGGLPTENNLNLSGLASTASSFIRRLHFGAKTGTYKKLQHYCPY
jgi:hypothetical protein